MSYCRECGKEVMTEGYQEALYQQGYIFALRKIQYKINGRCSELSKFITYDNVY